jgi:hypothetical protein
VTVATRIADIVHGRRAKGWPSTGKSPETATTAHTSKTGTPYVAGTDTDARDWRETKWNARDNAGRT